MIIFDVGANTGFSCLNYRENPNNFIYAFEPIPELLENYLYPLQSSNYFVIPKAVSDYDGTAKFNISRQCPSITDGSIYGCSSLYEFSENLEELWPGRTDFVYTQTIEIETVRMDSFMKENNICSVDFLHCDTQGNDLKVLKSFGDSIHLLKSGKVECFNKSNLYKEVENDFNSVTEFLKSKGFVIDEVVCNDDFEHELNVFFSRH